jgi:hypothetical protein
MATEFTINSAAIETKINQLLPSQGGFAPGVDFSASTMVIPVVDLTETAEGSGLRQDLQSSLSLNSVTAFMVANAVTTIINTTGYFRVFGNNLFSGAGNINFSLTDGTTTKLIVGYGSTGAVISNLFDFLVFLKAGDSLKIESSTNVSQSIGNTRQIADISGNLVNPT